MKTLANMTLPELVLEIEFRQKTMAHNKGMLGFAEEELTRRYSKADQFKTIGKESGSERFEIDGVKLKFEIGKTVKWDSKTLFKIWEKCSPIVRSALFSIKISVPEKQFDALEDAELIKAIRQARSVEYGVPKVTLAKD